MEHVDLMPLAAGVGEAEPHDERRAVVLEPETEPQPRLGELRLAVELDVLIVLLPDEIVLDAQRTAAAAVFGRIVLHGGLGMLTADGHGPLGLRVLKSVHRLHDIEQLLRWQIGGNAFERLPRAIRRPSRAGCRGQSQPNEAARRHAKFSHRLHLQVLSSRASS